MKALLLGLLVAGRVVAGGDFSFDVTSDASNNWVTVATNAAHRLTSTVTVAAAFTDSGGAGVQGNILCRQLTVTNRNYCIQDSGANPDKATASASSGSISGAGYSTTGTTTLSGQMHASSVFDSASSATLYVHGISEATDSSVATPDNPATGVTLGCGSTAGSTCTAAGDHRGSIASAVIYSVTLTAGEAAQLGAINAIRRPFRGRVGYWAMLGPSGSDLGTDVPDWSPTQATGDGSAGTDPTYTPTMQRGAGR